MCFIRPLANALQTCEHQKSEQVEGCIQCAGSEHCHSFFRGLPAKRRWSTYIKTSCLKRGSNASRKRQERSDFGRAFYAAQGPPLFSAVIIWTLYRNRIKSL